VNPDDVMVYRQDLDARADGTANPQPDAELLAEFGAFGSPLEAICNGSFHGFALSPLLILEFRAVIACCKAFRCVARCFI